MNLFRIFRLNWHIVCQWTASWNINVDSFGIDRSLSWAEGSTTSFKTAPTWHGEWVNHPGSLVNQRNGPVETVQTLGSLGFVGHYKGWLETIQIFCPCQGHSGTPLVEISCGSGDQFTIKLTAARTKNNCCGGYRISLKEQQEHIEKSQAAWDLGQGALNAERASAETIRAQVAYPAVIMGCGWHTQWRENTSPTKWGPSK